MAGGGDLVAHHQGAAVAEKGDDLLPRPAQCRGNRHRHAGAHRPDHRGQEDLALAEADIAMHEAAEIAGVGRYGRVGREVLVDLADDRREIDAVVGGVPFLGQQPAVDRVEPGDPALPLFCISRRAAL